MTAAQPQNTLEILLVEDNPGDVRLTREALKSDGLKNNVSVARDGEEALRMLRKESGHEDAPRPDLIFLDLNLPKPNGKAVLAEVKQDPELRRIPIVVLTTSGSEQDIRDTYDLHANAYVRKPFNLDDFIADIRAVEVFWETHVQLPTE